MFRRFAVMLFVDDKACICIGEPGVQIAAVSRGKQTVVQENIPLLVADHDTNTKVKLTPSDVLVAEILNSTLEGSFYRGQMFVTMKDTIFQPSTPMRHIAEIRHVLTQSNKSTFPICLLYSDGRPDHRVTYPSVQLSLIALFLLNNMDVLIAARCCPTQSFTNPVNAAMLT